MRLLYMQDVMILQTIETCGEGNKLDILQYIDQDNEDTKHTIREIYSNLKNYCQQNNLGFIENSNIDESYLGNKNDI